MSNDSIAFGHFYSLRHARNFHAGSESTSKTSYAKHDFGPLLNSSHIYSKSSINYDADILAVGCEVTSGLGIPREYLWPQLLAASSSLNVATCAFPGTGMMYQLFFALRHVANSRNLKKVLYLAPDAARAWVPTASVQKDGLFTVQQKNIVWSDECNYYIDSYETSDILLEGDAGPQFFLYNSNNDPYVVSPEPHIWANFRYLETFSNVMHTSGIEFLCSSWHDQTIDALDRRNHRGLAVPKYVPSSETHNNVSNRFGNPSNPSCGHEPQTKRQQEFWLSHNKKLTPGLHQQIHFAETLGNITIDNTVLEGVIQ